VLFFIFNLFLSPYRILPVYTAKRLLFNNPVVSNASLNWFRIISTSDRLFLGPRDFPHVTVSKYLATVAGHAVAQMVEALRYKPEDSGF
jgi:hypothetical protein